MWRKNNSFYIGSSARKEIVVVVKIILASGSPRRKELLEQIGLQFEISAAHGEEIITKTIPHEIVEELSLEKASEVAERYKEEQKDVLVIGADTIVAFENQILGKPKNEEDAKKTLNMLQDNIHQVYTGVTVIWMQTNGNKTIRTFHEKTDVTMYAMSSKQIEAYVATKEPLDKAGSYAIQGKCAVYVKGICGDYNNVVGLPVARLMQELSNMGIEGIS